MRGIHEEAYLICPKSCDGACMPQTLTELASMWTDVESTIGHREHWRLLTIRDARLFDEAAGPANLHLGIR